MFDLPPHEAALHRRVKILVGEMQMHGTPMRGNHLGLRQNGTVFWERDGVPYLEVKLRSAIREQLKPEAIQEILTTEQQLELVESIASNLDYTLVKLPETSDTRPEIQPLADLALCLGYRLVKVESGD